MHYDDVILEVWRVKDEIASQYHNDVHEYVNALREKRPQDKKTAAQRDASSIDAPTENRTSSV
jgi:hypothetical protein